jgi:hypothetical protein
MYYEGAKRIKKSTAEKHGFLLHAFFAEITVKDIFKKLASAYDPLHLDDTEEVLLSTVEEYANSKGISMESLIKEKLSLWLDNGLFIHEYQPLYLSERFNTWNGNTKMNHKELFIIWYTELGKSRKYLKKLFDSKKLKKQSIKKDFLGMTRTIEIITGDNLYASKEYIDFVQEYKKQIKILIPIVNIILFVEKNASPTMNYRTLCEFKDLAQKVSSVFDIDMTERYSYFVDSYKEEVNLLNLSLSRMPDIVMEHLYIEESFRYIVDIDDDCFKFDLETDAKAKIADIAEKYSEEFDKMKI